MITCEICGTEYEDHASYCNICDVSLIDEGGINLENNLPEVVVDPEEVLAKARKTASTVHRILGWMYFILLAIPTFLVFIGRDFNGHAYMLILLLPATIHLLAAEGLVKKKSWARPLSIVIGIVILIGFPIGTLCGIIILTQMFKKEWNNSHA